MADPKAAVMNFLNALERIPQIVEQYKAKNATHEADLPVLQDVAGKTWRKEDELKELKTELAALDRKIQLELAPPTQETGQEQTNQTKPEKEGMNNGNSLDNNVHNYDSAVIHNATEPTKGTNKGIGF